MEKLAQVQVRALEQIAVYTFEETEGHSVSASCSISLSEEVERPSKKKPPSNLYAQLVYAHLLTGTTAAAAAAGHLPQKSSPKSAS